MFLSVNKHPQTKNCTNRLLATMASEKPVIAIVPCAGQTAVYYRKLITPLREQGFTVLVPALLTEGLDDSIIGKTWNDDARHIQEVLRPYLDAGREAVVVGHSAGAIPVCFATKGLTLPERRSQGVKGGIKAAVFLGIWSLEKFSGKTMYEVLGGKYPSMIIEVSATTEGNPVPPPTYRLGGEQADPIRTRRVSRAREWCPTRSTWADTIATWERRRPKQQCGDWWT